MKRHEIFAIENEIEKGEALLQNLRDALLNSKNIPKKGKYTIFIIYTNTNKYELNKCEYEMYNILNSFILKIIQIW